MDRPKRGRWIKFYVSILDTKSHYPDGLRRAFDDLLLISAKQFEPGRFESEEILRATLGKRGRFVPRLIAEGDIVQNADGSLSVANYAQYQAPDTDAERMQRWRDRRRRADPAVTQPLRQNVTTDRYAIVTPVDSDVDIDVSRNGESRPRAVDAIADRLETIAANRAILDDPKAPEYVQRAARKALERLGESVDEQ